MLTASETHEEQTIWYYHLLARFVEQRDIPGADPGFFAGGGQRRPCTAGAFGVRADGGSRVDKHQIKVHSVHRIFRAIFFDFFFLAS